MALWMCRGGSRGQHEQKFLEDGRIYLTWSGSSRDLGAVNSQEEMSQVLKELYPAFPEGKIRQNNGQFWSFAKRMQPGDLVILPSKRSPSMHVGKITGPYTFEPTAPDPYVHWRSVEWLKIDIPKSRFDRDILASLGAFSTICQIQRNDAERRVREMAARNWSASSTPVARLATATAEDLSGSVTEDDVRLDLDLMARDEIAAHIYAKFKGHALEELVQAVLEAQGYVVYRSPEGPDSGVDLLAAPGNLGFGSPKICVQVKSQDEALDRATLDQLLGTMSNVDAERGLLVCWGGFKSTVLREKARLFFRVRLWDRDDLIEQILDNYDRLPEWIRGELPLKRIWTLALSVDEESE